MNPKQNRVLVLAFLFCATAIVTWHSIRSEAPVPERLPSLAEPLHAKAAILAARKSEASPVASRTLPERTIQFFSPELAPSWTVKLGQEFWRKPVPDRAAEETSENLLRTINPNSSLIDVDERANHALLENLVTGGAEVDAGNYSARVEGDGFKFSPKSAADRSTEIVFRTLSIQRDGQNYFSAERDDAGWSVIGNTAQALLSANWGMVEHYRAGNAGLAVTWIFPQPLPGAGSVEVVASIEGLTDAGETGPGHHFADRDGNARVRIGRAEAVDAAGTRWDLETRVAPDGSGKLIVELPVEIQAEAVYPLAIDPIIGPEFGLDKPVVCMASETQLDAAVADEGCHPVADEIVVTRQGPVIQFSSSMYSVQEGDTFAKVVVSLTGKYTGVITVDFSTSDETAQGGADYLPVSWRLVFANSKTTMVVPIPILTAAHPNETVTLKLQDPTGGAVLGTKHTATLTIK